VSRSAIATPRAPKPVGPYSQAVTVGDMVWCAGQIGLDPGTGRLVAGGTVAELRQAVANLAFVLAEAGCTLDDVVKTTVFLADLVDGPAVNAEYAALFAPPYPARSTVQVAALPAAARVEIEAVAVRRGA